MTVELKHSTQASGTDEGNGEIGKDEWNAGHNLTMASGRVLGRVTASAGAVEELAGMWVEVDRVVASNDSAVFLSGIDNSADEWLVTFDNLTGDDDYTVLFALADSGGEEDVYTGTWDSNSVIVGGSTPGLYFEEDSPTALAKLNAYASMVEQSTVKSSGLIRLHRPRDTSYMKIVETEIRGVVGGAPYVERGTHVALGAASFPIHGIAVAAYTAGSSVFASGTFVLLKRLK